MKGSKDLRSGGAQIKEILNFIELFKTMVFCNLTLLLIYFNYLVWKGIVVSNVWKAM